MKRSFEGKIVSVKMNRTVIVEVTRKTAHPLYKKLLKRSTRIKADSGEMTLSLGQKVLITETKPISKEKFFKVTEVLK